MSCKPVYGARLHGMTASCIEMKTKKSHSAKGGRCLEVTVSPVEAGYLRLLSAVLREPVEEVVTDLLLGRLQPAAR